MRIFELCSLNPSDNDLESNNIPIDGKGVKERIKQLGNQESYCCPGSVSKKYRSLRLFICKQIAV